MERSLHRWILPPERNHTIINYTRIDVNIRVNNNRVTNEGVGVDHVRRLTNQVIDRHDLKDARRPGDEREEARTATIYRPEIRKKEAAKPKEALDPDQARARIDSERSAAVTRRTPAAAEADLRQSQEQERKLLERDHQAEINEIRRKSNADRVSARGSVGKIDKETQAKIAEAKKRQDDEKAQLAKRQQAEAVRVKREPIKKKSAQTEKH